MRQTEDWGIEEAKVQDPLCFSSVADTKKIKTKYKYYPGFHFPLALNAVSVHL